jgi:hypothetical protein
MWRIASSWEITSPPGVTKPLAPNPRMSTNSSLLRRRSSADRRALFVRHTLERAPGGAGSVINLSQEQAHAPAVWLSGAGRPTACSHSPRKTSHTASSMWQQEPPKRGQRRVRVTVLLPSRWRVVMMIARLGAHAGPTGRRGAHAGPTGRRRGTEPSGDGPVAASELRGVDCQQARAGDTNLFLPWGSWVAAGRRDDRNRLPIHVGDDLGGTPRADVHHVLCGAVLHEPTGRRAGTLDGRGRRAFKHIIPAEAQGGRC